MFENGQQITIGLFAKISENLRRFDLIGSISHLPTPDDQMKKI
jgi:hypothetical protein